MSVDRYEAAAMLALYAAQGSYQFYDQAAQLALNTEADPASFIDAALTQTQHHPRLTFEAWINHPTTPQAVEHRIALQEAFAPYEGIARRVSSPILRALTISPIYMTHKGSGARAVELPSKTASSVLKVPHLNWGGEGRSLRPGERARFTEMRIQTLPNLPGTNFEKIKAASYMGAVVTSHIPGDPIYRLGPEMLEQVTDEHLWAAARDLDTTARARIRQDGNSDNTHFDISQGFGFFDPLSAGETVRWCRAYNMQSFGMNLLAIEDDAPKDARTPDCKALRTDLFRRFQPIAADVSGEAITTSWGTYRTRQ
jgi:hypothetical protein